MSKNKESYNPNITESDEQILGDRSGNLRSDAFDDESLKNREEPVDFAGEDLDIPGRELPSQKTKKTFKDEENQLYSLGTAHNENLESTED